MARCHHVCPCGAELFCRDVEHCTEGAHWRCAACEMDDQDDFFSRLNTTEQEHTTDEHQQRIPEQVSQS